MDRIDWPRLRSVVGEAPPPPDPGYASAALGRESRAAHSILEADPQPVADRALVCVRKLFNVQAFFARLEGNHLEFLLRTHAYQTFGYSSFRDFVREELQMSQRTATRRVALSRVLREHKELSKALDEDRVSPCQALIIGTLQRSGELSEWIERAGACTVRELKESMPVSEVDTDVLGRRLTFGATASASYVWDHGIELARQVLGWEAPVYKCVEAILAEAAADLGEFGINVSEAQRGPARRGMRRSAEKPSGRRANRELSWSEELENLQDTVVTAEAELKILETLSRTDPDDAEGSVAFLQNLKLRDRCLRLLFAQLLHDAGAAGVIAFWGYDGTSEFLIHELKVSERTAKRYLSEAWTFERNPALRHAYCSGHIGLGQAYLVNRVATSRTLDSFIARATRVTHLQFEREIAFLERLAEFLPDVALKVNGPLGKSRLEGMLRKKLKKLGWKRGEIDQRFGSILSGDPARNPMIMARLEELLEVVVLAQEELELAVLRSAATLATRDEPQVLARLATGNGAQLAATLAIGDGAEGTATLATQQPATLATGPGTTISFWAPQALLDDWSAVMHGVQARFGPLPAWAAAIFVLQIAVQEWERGDPARRPAEWKVLQRDRWRCQTPGCSGRRKLEVHHIIFRSRGGPDDPENLTTLCHSHHQHGIHEEGLLLEGSAPHRLRWRLGRDRWFLGSKRTKGGNKSWLSLKNNAVTDPRAH